MEEGQGELDRELGRGGRGGGGWRPGGKKVKREESESEDESPEKGGVADEQETE